MVIAIIAILAGMLMPALGKTKAVAVQIECMNNERQISHAFRMYAEDFNDYYPPYNLRAQSWAYCMFWPSNPNGDDKVYNLKYMSRKVLRCGAVTNGVPEPGHGYYGYNYRGLGFRMDISGALQRHSSCLKPSQQYVVMDAEDPVTLAGKQQVHCYKSDSNGSPAPRHNLNVNILFADGHVEAWKMPSRTDRAEMYKVLGSGYYGSNPLCYDTTSGWSKYKNPN